MVYRRVIGLLDRETQQRLGPAADADPAALDGDRRAVGGDHWWQTGVYGLQLPLGLCYLAVGASIIANLISIFSFPRTSA